MGPLSGYRVIELAGIGPAPMCAMLLSDMGAEVLRIDRTADAGLGVATETKYSLLNRGRRSVAFDLKRREATDAVLRLVERASVDDFFAKPSSPEAAAFIKGELPWV